MRAALAACVVVLAARPQAGRAEAPPAAPAGSEAPAPPSAPLCAGEYADELSLLVPRARELDRDGAPYTYCIRATATYECPYYAADGSLRRTRRRVVAHGTGFGLRQQDQATLLVTNAHVAEWPPATDADHRVEDVPAGCRRVADTLRIVENERDDFEPDDVALSRVVSDPALDLAVLRSPRPLAVLPWRIGHSGGLRERNVVTVRGFPLGAFQAENVGKVISPIDRDREGDWEHDDFVIDALLSPGNSGSPVLAVSCATGQFELVGVYHAGYSRGTALNVVVGIDQARELLSTLKRSPRRPATASALDAGARDALWAGLPAADPFFPFGGLAASVRSRPDGALVFEVHAKDFPLAPSPVLVLEDLPAPPPLAGFGTLGNVHAGRGGALRPYAASALDAEVRGQVERILDALRVNAVRALELQRAERGGVGSRADFERVSRLRAELGKADAKLSDLAQLALELAERLSPRPGDPVVSAGDLRVPPGASASARRP